jgi:predicted Rossmann-fold nucleotide-binding protein
VVAPGGIGTVLELMMVWQLLQVRHVHDVPLILVGKMWADLVDWARTHLLTSCPPLANSEDMLIPRCVNTTDEAIALIREQHAQWLRQSKA